MTSGNMSSKILGFITIDDEQMAPEIDKIVGHRWTDAYNDYAIGHWSTIMLWNRSGLMDNGYSEEYSGAARKTEVGRDLVYLNSVIERTFDAGSIKSVRVFRAGNNGLIIPHIDYMEFKRGFNRVHIPIRTNDDCFNSEKSFLYHMRKSEIWWLDGTVPHSGGCFSDLDRLHLVIDFCPTAALDDVIIVPSARTIRHDPKIISRQGLAKTEAESILNLYRKISVENFRDIVCDLSKVHFRRDVPAEAMYEWLDEITQMSGSKTLMNKAAELRRKFIGDLDTRGASITKYIEC